MQLPLHKCFYLTHLDTHPSDTSIFLLQPIQDSADLLLEVFPGPLNWVRCPTFILPQCLGVVGKIMATLLSSKIAQPVTLHGRSYLINAVKVFEIRI